MTDNYEYIQVEPISPALGAEISGVDLSKPGAGALDEIKRAFADFGVIFFRDQLLTPEQHIALAENFGEININRFFSRVKDYPMIAEVLKEPDAKRNIGEDWHTDHSYDQVPAMGSILYAREVPPIGGDTLFASMYRAYDSLSDGLKQTLSTLRALHSSRQAFGYQAISEDPEYEQRFHNPDQAVQDSVHPMVITHPLSGRKALYVNPDFTVGIEGWSKEESAALLGYLYQHAAKPEFQCRFQWRKHSVAFWDNRATWHCALNDYHGHRRLMHRITLEGVPLAA